MSYARSILKRYKDEVVEVLFGSDWGARLYAEFHINNKPVLTGKVVDADSDLIDLEVEFDNTKKVISINTWSIQSISKRTEKSHALAFTKQVLGKQ